MERRRMVWRCGESLEESGEEVARLSVVGSAAPSATPSGVRRGSGGGQVGSATPSAVAVMDT
eukprot:423883-Prorocentrum_minimum.AAC.1